MSTGVRGTSHAPSRTVQQLQNPPSRSTKTLTPLAEIPSGLSAEKRRLAGQMSLATTGLGLASGLYLSSKSQPELRQIGMLTLGASILGGLARWQFGRVFNWQPVYDVEGRDGRLEVRRYYPEIHAVTVVAEPWEHSLEEGFRRLAAYISGANARGTTIPMTSPVLSTIAPRSTLPASGSPGLAAFMLPIPELMAAGPRQVDFVMPGGFTFSDLPIPDDSNVRIVRVPERRIAALRFHGRYGGDIPAHKRNELLSLAKVAGLNPRSEVWFAGYDAPWTLPALRRNEVMVELDD